MENPKLRYDSGAIVSDVPNEGLQDLFEDGSSHLLCETVTKDGARLIIGSISFMAMIADRIEGPDFIDSAILQEFIDVENEQAFIEWLDEYEIKDGADCILAYMEFLNGKA